MELHIIFFILAGLLIAVLVGFSIWSARREKSQIFSNSFSTRAVAVPPPSEQSNEQVSIPKPNMAEYEAMSVPEENPQQIQQEVESSLQNIKISLPNSEQSVEKAAVQTHTYGQRISTQQHIQNQAESQHSNMEPEVEPVVEINPVQAEPQPAVAANPFVTLYLYAPQNEHFRGDFVVHYLEEMGFRFGEHQIFHRHQHIDDVSSPVIFSAANLLNPGTFDLSRINQFSTAGLVLFMQLPTVGSDIANMKLFIGNAEHLAHSLGGFLYDDQQQPFDEQSRQRYMQRVMH